MNRIHRMLCLLAALLVILSVPAFPALAESQAMECDDMVLTDKDGNEVTLYSFAGKPVIINFWATWCPWCVYEFPAYQKLFEQYGDQIVFIMADQCDGYAETPEKALAWLEENGYTFPPYFDTVNYAYRNFGWSGIPGSVFIRADGTVQLAQLGAMQEEALFAAAEALLKEAPAEAAP